LVLAQIEDGSYLAVSGILQNENSMVFLFFGLEGRGRFQVLLLTALLVRGLGNKGN